MPSINLSGMPSLRRQHLLAEFSGLKQACPEGIFVSLTPGEVTLWSGAMFIRRGPYENAILRFQISFPDTYPRLPPLVTFSSDMFHPLIAPLTTYMYTTDIQDNGTVSATDDERLPPGGFSLRHGFPGWFGRRGRSNTTSARQVSGGQQPPATPAKGGSSSVITTPDSRATAGPTTACGSSISTYEVLQYIRSTFDDETVLDSVPLEAAGNPGAWHAWRTRQRQRGKLSDSAAPPANASVSKVDGDNTEAEPEAEGGEKGDEKEEPPAKEGVEVAAATVPPSAPTMSSRDPGQWNWAGVWEDRVKKGIAASLSEPVLYGGAAAGDDLIHFLPMEENDVGVVKDNLLRTLGSTA
ncbi:Protein crossbronx like protein [Verticillium longisporum]|uniref:Protein crossbronx like protein n=1 Tax=Verticillium longisporum TaxID=100787 RepID=A0A8I3AS25_VERLO|nr:Protein crossbronx like protein [Verticillium longisporum]KAG7131944.1 Protein crossbronx like protein [Verticillium longisporum]